MIKIFKRLLEFSGSEKKNLILSFLFYMCNSFFKMLPIMAVLTVLAGKSLCRHRLPRLARKAQRTRPARFANRQPVVQCRGALTEENNMNEASLLTLLT